MSEHQTLNENDICEYIKEEDDAMPTTSNENDMKRYAEEELMLSTVAQKAGLPLSRVKVLRARYAMHFSGKGDTTIRRWEIALIVMIDAVNKASFPKYLKKDNTINEVVRYAKVRLLDTEPSYWVTERFTEELKSIALQHIKDHSTDENKQIDPFNEPRTAPAQKQSTEARVKTPDYEGITSHFIEVWILNDNTALIGDGSTEEEALVRARRLFLKRNGMRSVSVVAMFQKELQVEYTAKVELTKPRTGE